MSEPKRVINEKTGLMVLAGPMFIEMLLNICVNNIDTLMLSHYAENAVGAIGNANQIMNLVIIMFNIIATATSIVVAQYLGARALDKMNMIYSLAFIMNFIIGIAMSAVLVLFNMPILELMKVQSEMQGYASTYLTIVGGGIFLQAAYNVMIQILRCNGDSKIGMYVAIVMNVINIIGNWVFLYGPLRGLNLGVAGVAIATDISRLAAVIISIAVFYKRKIGRLSLRYLHPFPARMLCKMIRIGLPSAGETFSYSMYQLVLLSFVNRLSVDAVNARGYCNAVIAFDMVFSNSAAMATQIIVGHLVGAGKRDEAYHRVFQTLRLTLPVTIGLSTANWLMSPLVLRLFTDNQEVIRIGWYVMLADIFVEIGRCLNMTFVGSLKAAGDYVFPLLVGLVVMWGFGATVGYGMGIAYGLGLVGIYIGTATDECIRGLITMYRFRKKKWYRKTVVDSQDAA